MACGICIICWYVIYFCRKCLFIYIQMYNCFVFSTPVTRGKNLQPVIFHSIPATSFGRITVLIFYYIWYNTSINILVSVRNVVAVLLKEWSTYVHFSTRNIYFWYPFSILNVFYIYFQFCCYFIGLSLVRQLPIYCNNWGLDVWKWWDGFK